MSKLSDDEQLVKLILIQAKIMPYWSQDDDDNMKKLLSRIARGGKAIEAMEKLKNLYMGCTINEGKNRITEAWKIITDYQQSEEAEG